MATDPTSKLDKGFEQRADTSAARAAWQEMLDRHVSIPASKSVEAAEVLRGFAGSWAGSFELGLGGSSEEGGPLGVPALQKKTNLLGLPGMGEINFVPYDHGTHRFGPKGPSLLGHPISFEIVGPTLKAHLNDWQWRVVDNSGVPGLGDQIYLDFNGADSYSSRSSPGSGALQTYLQINDSTVTRLTLDDIYGFTTIKAFPGNAVYIVINMTGESTAGVLLGPAGPGDGDVGDHNGDRVAIQANTPSSKTEIFRVVSVDNATGLLNLDSSKRLADYFTISGTIPVCRSLTLLQPIATRLAAVPGSGPVGKEKVFAVIPPERAARGEYLPIAAQFSSATWGTGADYSAWNGYQSVGGLVGNPGDYTNGPLLPIPIPKEQTVGRFPGTFNVALVNVLSTWGRLRIPAYRGYTPTADDVGRIIYIYDVEIVGDAPTFDSGSTVWAADPGYKWLMGYHEVTDVQAVGNWVEVRRIPELDPSTGVAFHAPVDALEPQFTPTGAEGILLKWAWCDPISSLWTSPHPSIDKISASRLTNLIDPSWTSSKGSLKTADEDGELYRGSPDKAAFNTASSNLGLNGSNADPGNLMDLGFRVVLYPAINDPTHGMIPDFDHPITSREVILDPSINEAQWLDIDYSSGLVTLSHTPVPGTGCEVAPNGILSGIRNPRRELVLYAACVPFSREKGQLGANPRVTSGQQGYTDDLDALVASADAHSERVYWRLANQTITSGTHRTIELAELIPTTELPVGGYVELVTGLNPEGPLMFNYALWGPTATFSFQNFQTVGGGGGSLLEDCNGGEGASTYTVDEDHPAIAVLRRDVRLPSTFYGDVGTSYAHDVTYGAFKRASSLRFALGSLKHEIDGSITLDNREYLAEEQVQLWKSIFHDGLLSGGGVSYAAGEFTVGASEVLFNGRYYNLPAGTVTTSVANGTVYVYIGFGPDGHPTYLCDEDGLPLPGLQTGILLYRGTLVAAVITSEADLRRYLLQVDQRFDVTVGGRTGGDPVYPMLSPSPHFLTLQEAVTWVNELAEPVFTDSANYSTHGRYFRIVVVGRTLETSTIEIGVDGLIIEGAMIRTDSGTSPTTAGDTSLSVRWQGLFGLFELGAHSDITIRDLNFEYWDLAQGPPTVANKTYLFGSTVDATSDRVLLERCRLSLKGSGASGARVLAFVWVPEGVCRRWTIRDNYSETSNFGVYFGPDITAGTTLNTVTNSLIENNKFLTDGGAPVALAGELYGGVVLNPSGSSSHNMVLNNEIQEHETGVFSGDGAESTLIKGNQILFTPGPGIFTGGVGGGTTAAVMIYGNSLDLCHSAVAGGSQIGTLLGWAEKRGIAARNSSDTAILDNWVKLDGAGYAITADVTDSIISGNRAPSDAIGRLIATAASTDNIWAHNIVSGEIAAGWTDVISNNTLGGITAGQGCTITANHFANASTFTLSTDIRLIGNQYGGSNTISVGADSTVVGNSVGSALLQIDARTNVASNHVDSIGAAATLSYCAVLGNRVASDLTGAPATLFSTWVGNVFEDAATFGNFNDSVFGSNTVFGDLVLGAASQQSVISGNYVGGFTCTLPGDALMVGSNSMVASVALSGSDVVFSGNRINGTVTATGDSGTYSGNRIGGNLDCSGTDDYLISGNRVGGNIIVDAGASPASTPGILLGNRAAAIRDTAGTGTIPSAYAVVLGNKVASGANVFTVNPGTDSVGSTAPSQIIDFNVTT